MKGKERKKRVRKGGGIEGSREEERERGKCLIHGKRWVQELSPYVFNIILKILITTKTNRWHKYRDRLAKET